MQIFYRQSYTQLWITLYSNESLGILDTAYVEDYFGVDGQLTLRKMSDNSTTAFLMNALPAITPAIANDVFEGYVDLTTLTNGFYRVEGRVKDTLGHYTILSAFQTPNGSETTSGFDIQILPGSVVVSFPKQASISQKFLFGASVKMKEKFSLVGLASKNNWGTSAVSVKKLEATNIKQKQSFALNVKIAPKLQLDIVNAYVV